MSTISLELRDGIHVMTLINAAKDNTLTTATMREYLAAFDQVEQYQGETALMLTCEHEKTFCTGIDLAWLNTQNTQDIMWVERAIGDHLTLHYGFTFEHVKYAPLRNKFFVVITPVGRCND